MTSISLRNIQKTFGKDTQVIKDVNLEIAPGEFCVFLGPSGCGKSTLLRMIAGIEDVTAGDLAIGGVRMNEVPAAKRQVAMVFQSYALYPHMSVYENMAFGLRQAKVDKNEIDQRVREAAQILQLEPLLERMPRALSGGQRQRVAIGRAIVRSPNVFLFDEPLSNLDAALRVHMRAEISRLHKKFNHASAIYVTHDQTEAMAMADKIVLLRAGPDMAKYGSVAQIGTPMDLYHRPSNRFVAAFLGSPSMNVIEGTVRRSGGECWVEAQGARWPVPATAAAPDGQPVHYGIRPGDMTLGGGSHGVEARVIVVEPTGAETELLVQVGEAKLVLAVHGRVDAGPDDTVRLAIDAERVHLFDRQTGRRMG